MKICMVGSGVVPIPPKKGGAVELIIDELSKHMPARGHDVTVFDIKDGRPGNEKIEGAVHKRMRIPRFSNMYMMRLSELYFGVRSLAKCMVQRHDVVHCQTVFSALPFAVLKPLARGKVVYTCHNPSWTFEQDSKANKAVIWLEGFVMKRADRVTTVSKTMKNAIVKRAGIGPDKIEVIYNFVDRKRFRPMGTSWKKKRKIGKMVLFVSKLSENKGVDVFIRVAKMLKHTGAKFVVVGPVSFEFETRNKWTDLAREIGADNVVFAGPASNDELPEIYSSGDVFLFPTKKEAFGIVLIESMACGTPVVTTDLPVTREIVGRAGQLCKRDDAIFAKSVERMLAGSAKMSKEAVRNSARFDIGNVMNDYDRFYRRIA